MIKRPKNTNRIARVNAFVQIELAKILLNYLEKNSGLVTITKVETSKDMKHAKVWLSIFGGNDDRVLTHLTKNIYAIQGELNQKFNTKIVPRISFTLDTSPSYAAHISRLIDKLKKENEF